MARFVFVPKWIPGKLNIDADALFRAPMDRATKSDELGEGPQAPTARIPVISLISNSDKCIYTKLEAVKVAAVKDPVMAELQETIMAEFSNEKCNLVSYYSTILARSPSVSR